MQKWQRYAVLLKGESEPVVVQTTARDFAAVRIDGDAGLAAVGIMFQTVQAALLREGYGVPRDYDSFLDVLEGMPETLDDGDPSALNPTSAARSDTPP